MQRIRRFLMRLLSTEAAKQDEIRTTIFPVEELRNSNPVSITRLPYTRMHE